MTAVVGSDAALLNSVQNAIGDFEEQQLLGDIEEVLSLASKLRAAIVCMPALVPDEAARIATLHSRCPLLPVFVVARLSPTAVEAAYRLHSAVTIVWVDELGSLSAKLAEHLAKKPMELVYETVRHRSSLSSLMLKALVLICVSPSPFS